MEAWLILLLAVSIDVLLGDPPDALHPVAWVGRVVSFSEKFGFKGSSRVQFLYGMGITLLIVGLFAVPAYFVLFYLEELNGVVYIIVAALVFKSTFSLKGLGRAALQVKVLLSENKLDEARFRLRSLVSRDTSRLSRPLLVSAAVESLAENLSDSFIAPLFYFLLLGIPGAVAYRVVNTMDAMIGYHGRYEYLGKFASRLDDILNIIPARLAAMLLVLAAFLSRRNWRNSWRVALSEHSRTESPNAGWPMAAMSGALNLELEKVGYYKLGSASGPAAPEAIDASLGLIQIAALLWCSVCFMVGGMYFVLAA